MSRYKKSAIVVIGALILSVVGIQASDTLRGLEGSLTGNVNDADAVCGPGAVQFLLGSHALCVDQFEASPDEDCPHSVPTNPVHTQDNVNFSACAPVSQPEVIPWRFVSLAQAQQLCARTGKRLPTNEEWYKFSSGLADQSDCVLNSGNSPEPTGGNECVTPAGVYDVVGNLWEWIEGSVTDGQYDNRAVPESGYVSLVDADGVVLETSAQPSDEFGADYAWTKNPGVYGVIRGGFYGSESDGGIFAQNLSVPFDFKTSGVGFRCVRDI